MTYFLMTEINGGDTFESCFSCSEEETEQMAMIEIAHETASESQNRTHAIVGYDIPDGVDYYEWIGDMFETPDPDYYKALD